VRTQLSTFSFKYALVFTTCTSRASSIEILSQRTSSLKKATSSRFVISDGAYSQTTANIGIHSVERSSIWLQR